MLKPYWHLSLTYFPNLLLLQSPPPYILINPFIMTLPCELIIETLRYLIKADLKNVRLVSKLWSACATEHLFTKLYISPHQLNIEVFDAVTGNPALSRWVRELEYDVADFSYRHITKLQYFNMLWDQTSTRNWARNVDYESADPEIKHYLTFFNKHLDEELLGSPGVEVWEQCSGFAFVEKGYQQYMELASAERDSDQRQLLKSLADGLKHLPRLTSVRLRRNWPKESQFGLVGSPLARSWRPFQTIPGCYDDNSDQPYPSLQVLHGYQVLTLALSEARNPKFRKLSMENALAQGAFVQDLGSGQFSTDPAVAAYCRLKDLKLSLATSRNVAGLESDKNVYGLQRMLESMTLLERLELRLPHVETGEPPYRAWHSLAIPKSGAWPHLVSFWVTDLAISTKDLMRLLLVRMPSLNHLGFGRIKLLDGSWEGIVEYLRVSGRLSHLYLSQGTWLFDHESIMYLNRCRRGRDHHTMRGLIRDYVIYGHSDPALRHPSLLPHQPSRDSQAYLSDLFHLCDEYDSRGEQTVLIRTMLEDCERYQRLMAEVEASDPKS